MALALAYTSMREGSLVGVAVGLVAAVAFGTTGISRFIKRVMGLDRPRRKNEPPHDWTHDG